ncbi:DNA-formamidopyrimidine glycosylase family protein [Pedobacter sp. PACM 27299]|uniref:DNA-formamidopyrimidine glycosylase family protein n=1 Tax=Pedobacter sp. PACM 27299 TaxID=1727164 RepID=UPI001E54F15F|nr:DNA-formamidopyrimidine glycosylase family protein [Pedobacter sp. PACM 27299]
MSRSFAMPEGPSIVILRELVESLHLEGQQVIGIDGNTKIEKERMLHQHLLAFRSWGKHFLICFETFTLRIHFMMFGSYRINERKESAVRLRLSFEEAELNFYTCSLKYVEGDINDSYDWSIDVMAEEWDPKQALKIIRAKPEELICDLLLDQQIFSGVGNIIKNEVLYRAGIHPLSKIAAIPLPKLKLLVKEARQYSFDFLAWKKAYVLKKHWLVNTKKHCPLDHPLEKGHLGKTRRRTFYCTICQKLYIKLT